MNCLPAAEYMHSCGRRRRKIINSKIGGTNIGKFYILRKSIKKLSNTLDWSKSMAEKYNEYTELAEKLKCYIDRLFLDNHIKGDEIKGHLKEIGLYHILSDFIQDSKIRKQIKIIEAVRKMKNEKIQQNK